MYLVTADLLSLILFLGLHHQVFWVDAGCRMTEVGDMVVSEEHVGNVIITVTELVRA